MIRVTKEEANYIKENSKSVRIITTGKNKNAARKKRFADETYETFRLLKKFHSGGVRNGI